MSDTLRRWHNLAFATVVVLVVLSSEALGQDAQYWNNHYGTKGVLLGGAVIGSVEDLSATFYNPGYLGVKPVPGVSIGTGVFDFSHIRIDNDSLLTEPLTQLSVQPAPGIVAGQIPSGADRKTHWAFSVIGRQSVNTLVTQQAELTDESGRLVALDTYSNNTLTDYWGGVTWAREITEKIGVGATLYGAYRGHRRRSDASTEALKESGAVSSSSITEAMNFWHVRMILKAGVYFEEGDWTGGVTVTSAGLPIIGNGEAYYRRTVIGVTTNDEDKLVPLSNESGSVTYHSPWSIGAGFGVQVGDLRIHASAEWFSHVAAYEVMDPITGRQGDSTISVTIVDELRSLMNFGVGLEYEANATTSYYLSFVSDLSAIAKDVERSLAYSSWNIFHVSGGSVFLLDDISLTTGLGFAFGSGDSQTLSLFGGVVDPNEDDRRLDVTWYRLRALIGFTYEL